MGNLFAGTTAITLIITVVTLCFSGVITIAVLGVTGFFLYRMFKGMGQNSNLMANGVMAPAMILNVQDTGASLNDKPQAAITLQVNPPGQAPFQAVSTMFIDRFQVGMLIPGAQVQVKYDPANPSKVVIASFGPGIPSKSL